jgi:hypothetical protein
LITIKNKSTKHFEVEIASLSSFVKEETQRITEITGNIAVISDSLLGVEHHNSIKHTDNRYSQCPPSNTNGVHLYACSRE